MYKNIFGLILAHKIVWCILESSTNAKEQRKMPKYITEVNYGYGDEVEVIEAENLTAAEMVAAEIWREGAENNASYQAILLTKDSAEEYGVEEELED
jgi:hypothetical protein